MAKTDKKDDKSKDKAKKPTPKKDTKKSKAPAKKKDDKGDVKNKARSLLMKHPEIAENARALFRNENGKTIVEEIVPRGDMKKKDVIYPRSQGDLKEEDMRGLAVYANSLIDKTLQAYDKAVAHEDALTKAIGSKDDGKYAGKVNANTFDLILGIMGGMKKAADEQKDEEESEEEKEEKPTAVERGKELVKRQIEKTKERKPEKSDEGEEPAEDETPEEGKMDKKALQEERTKLLEKAAAIDTLLDEGTEKEAAETMKCPTCGSKVLKATKYCVKCKKKIGEKAASEEEEGKTEETVEANDNQTIVDQIDDIAETLEKQGDFELFKIAFQLDQVSDVLQGKKEAKTLESDPDEAYMKKYFQAGLREGDADEKSYMNEFNNDNTTEVERVPGNVSVEHKKASENLPYDKKENA